MNDLQREIPGEEQEAKNSEPFFGSQLMMTRLQETIKERMNVAKPKDVGIDIAQKDSNANLETTPKISIYEMLRVRQVAKQELLQRRETLMSSGRR